MNNPPTTTAVVLQSRMTLQPISSRWLNSSVARCHITSPIPSDHALRKAGQSKSSQVKAGQAIEKSNQPICDQKLATISGQNESSQVKPSSVAGQALTILHPASSRPRPVWRVKAGQATLSSRQALTRLTPCPLSPFSASCHLLS